MVRCADCGLTLNAGEGASASIDLSQVTLWNPGRERIVRFACGLRGGVCCSVRESHGIIDGANRPAECAVAAGCAEV